MTSVTSLAVYRQGVGSTSAGNLNTFVQTPYSATDLLALVGLPGMVMFVQGDSGPGTGNAMFYYWNPSATGGSGAIIPPGAALGCWLPLQLGAGATVSGLGYRFVSATTPSPAVVSSDHLGVIFIDTVAGHVGIAFSPDVLDGETVTFVLANSASSTHTATITDGVNPVRTLSVDQTSCVLKAANGAIYNIPAAMAP